MFVASFQGHRYSATTWHEAFEAAFAAHWHEGGCLLTISVSEE